jgi:SAM-dependent methyltransferase
MAAQQYIPASPDLSHLGGYVVGGDDATWYPDLWRWLAAEFNVTSVLDIGCGEGHSLKFFRDDLGCEVAGVDGLPQTDESIIALDFTKAEFVPARDFDLAWCCEFVEHIEEKHLPNFLSCFKASRHVAMTHAAPGQGGHHHVNCRTTDYWLGVMAACGFRHLPDKTEYARRLAARNPSPWNHFARCGMIFQNLGDTT